MKISTIYLVAGTFLSVTLLGCSKDSDIPNVPVAEPDSTRRFSYNDGIYRATGEYGGLPSHIIVTLTLRNDTVRAVQVEPQATDPTSLNLQRRFAEAVPSVVVGRHLDEVNVGRLAGSSGTPRGFNDAVAQVKTQAVKQS
jgi:uncharacterized protein with FMN-binding domain